MTKQEELEDNTLKEFDDFLEDLNEQLDNLPEAPKGIKDEEFDKEEKELKTKLRASYWSAYTKRVSGLKETYEARKKELEKSFVFKKTFRERLLMSPKLQIKIITPYGLIKTYKKKIKGSKVTVMKGDYKVQLNAIMKEGGRPTIYYHQGNPFPIVFDSEKFPYLISAESIRQMFNANIVSQIFAGLNIGKTVAWTAGIVLAIGGGVFLFMTVIRGMMTDTTPIIMLLPFWRIKQWLRN